MSHTPGPWWYDEEEEAVFASSGPIGRAEPASGPLMAAAPDLLVALEDLLDTQVEDSGTALALEQNARDAIRKARGES